MKTLVMTLSILISIVSTAQNINLKHAIKHYNSQNFGIAEKEINQALDDGFSTDGEVAQAMYYYYLIHMQVYGYPDPLKNNIHISEKIAEAYTHYTRIEKDKKSEMLVGLHKLSSLLTDIAQKQYLSGQYSQYFYTMDHVGLLLETIGEPTGEYTEKLAEDATKLGHQLRAISYWHKMIQKDYKKEYAYKELLSMLYNLKKYDHVDQLLKQAKNDFPDSYSFAEVEILRHVDKGMKYTALQLAKDVISKDSNNVDVIYLYGLLSTQHNEHDEALSSFIRVAHMKTDHFETNRELGKYYYRFSNKDGHFDLAIAYLEKAHKLAPEDSETKDLLNSIYLETGNEAKATSINSY